jgi:hypothetical protein
MLFQKKNLIQSSKFNAFNSIYDKTEHHFSKKTERVQLFVSQNFCIGNVLKSIDIILTMDMIIAK